jgi:hypothetical protein
MKVFGSYSFKLSETNEPLIAQRHTSITGTIEHSSGIIEDSSGAIQDTSGTIMIVESVPSESLSSTILCRMRPLRSSISSIVADAICCPAPPTIPIVDMTAIVATAAEIEENLVFFIILT